MSALYGRSHECHRFFILSGFWYLTIVVISKIYDNTTYFIAFLSLSMSCLDYNFYYWVSTTNLGDYNSCYDAILSIKGE